jgi:SAM-dependent methyltransferase
VNAVKQFLRRALYHLGLSGVYFRLVEWRLARGREAPPDTDAAGLPLPPLNLIALTVAHADWRSFLKTGEATATALDKHAAAAGFGVAGASSILDFGCGAGRVIRHLPSLTNARLYGTDYNPALIGWCAANLPGEFSRNELTPPLVYDDAQFDLVYALSVFTHLRPETQRVWLAEYSRILRPGGLALISFHDENQPGFPDAREARARMSADGFYIFNDMAEGTNLISTFQTQDHVRRLFAEAFEIVEIVSREGAGVGQTLAVLRRPAP